MLPRHVIELEGGVKVELLFTPSLFGVASRKGLSIVIEDRNNPALVMEAYVKVIYMAALNAWEAKAYDTPDLGDFSPKYADFQAWAATHPRKFSELVSVAFETITGKTIAEAAELEKEKQPEAEEHEKKKSRLTLWRRLTGRRSGHSS